MHDLSKVNIFHTRYHILYRPACILNDKRFIFQPNSDEIGNLSLILQNNTSCFLFFLSGSSMNRKKTRVYKLFYTCCFQPCKKDNDTSKAIIRMSHRSEKYCRCNLCPSKFRSFVSKIKSLLILFNKNHC